MGGTAGLKAKSGLSGPGVEDAQTSVWQNCGDPAFRGGLLLRSRWAQVWRDTIPGLQVHSRRESSRLLVHRFDQPGGVSGHHLPDDH